MLPAGRHVCAGLVIAGAMWCLAWLSPAAAQADQRREVGNIWREPKAQPRHVMISRATCESYPTAVWMKVSGEEFCARYYFAEGKTNPREAIIYLTGDVPRDYLEKLQLPPSSVPAHLQTYPHLLAESGLTGILLARMGLFGSSGDHNYRRTFLEIDFTMAAIDHIKARHGIETFHLLGQSGGASLSVGLTARRTDLGCVVLGAGRLFLLDRERRIGLFSVPSQRFFDAEQEIESIIAGGGKRIIVVSDRRDRRSPFASEVSFVTAMRERGRSVEHIFVDAPDPEHHNVVRQATGVMHDCVAGLDGWLVASRWGRTVSPTPSIEWLRPQNQMGRPP
jgi:hypothetical protein